MPLTPSTGWVTTPVRGVAINWNGGSPCVGMLGRHDPVRSPLRTKSARSSTPPSDQHAPSKIREPLPVSRMRELVAQNS